MASQYIANKSNQIIKRFINQSDLFYEKINHIKFQKPIEIEYHQSLRF